MALVVDLSIYVFICLSTEFILFEMNRRWCKTDIGSVGILLTADLLADGENW